MSHSSSDSENRRHAPYYIYCPPFRETSGGVRAMHYLCHWLNESGEEAYLINEGTSDKLNTPVLKPEIGDRHRLEGREPVVIYPEVIHGNPLQARHVVRYLLNIPGRLTDTPIDLLGWSKNDIVYTHGWDIVPEGWQAGLLQVPLLDTSVFHPEGAGERKGSLVWLHRYLAKGGEPLPLTADSTEISYRVPVRTPEQLAELYRSAEMLYTYEHTTACFEALLCGCPVVYLPNPLTMERPVHSYLGDDGVAWGASDEAIARARATVHLVSEKYAETRKAFLEELKEFISHTQSRVSGWQDKLASLNDHDLVLRTTRLAPAPALLPAGELPLPDQRVRVGILTADVVDGACARLRLLDPLSMLSPWLDVVSYPGKNSLGCRAEGVDIEKFAAWADVFIVQRAAFSKNNMTFIDKLQITGKPMIFELDDWLPAMPASHRQFSEFDPTNLGRIWREKLHLFSAAMVSTEPLAHKLRPFVDKVVVFPNVLSGTRIAALPQRENEPDARVAIGFAGTATHQDDMKIIARALHRINDRFGAPNVRFVFWGSVPPGFEGQDNVSIVQKGAAYPDYLKELARLNIDIGIAPLEESLFNLGKSDLKWLEYTAVGAACVLSDAPAYAEAKALGLAEVVDNDSESWENALSRLIEDKAHRQRLRDRSFDYLQQHGLLEKKLGIWVEALKSVLPKSRASVLDSFDLNRLAPVDNTLRLIMSPDSYREWSGWRDRHEVREIDAEMMAERMLLTWKQQPLFNLIMPVRENERERLSVTLDALQRQLYKRWRLIVVADWEQPDPIFSDNDTLGWLQVETLDDPVLYTQALNGLMAELPCDWVMLLKAGAKPEPQLMLRLGDMANEHPQALAIYTDHDSYTQPECPVLPMFKPDFSLDYLRAYDYIDGAVAMSYQGLVALGGFEAYPGAEVWNHLLRLAENYGLDAIKHLDEVLLQFPLDGLDADHQREAARQVALEQHLARLGIQAAVSKGYEDNTLYIDFAVTGEPMVSIIIPTKDKLEFLQPCVESLFANTAYPNFEVIVVDNGSSNPDTHRFYEDWVADYPERFRIVPYPDKFNFSAQCNLGVEAARGDYVLLLNNDTEIIQKEWLQRLIGLAQRPEVGAVGPRLVYPEIGRIQHAGIVLGMPGGTLSVADHVYEKAMLDEPGYMKRLLTEQNYSAVTAACLLVSKEKYQAVGGFDATELTVLFNDVDFCLKLQRHGLLNVFTPYVTVVHHHAKSIGKLTFEPAIALEAAVREQKEMGTMLRRWLPVLARDPGYNRHLTLRNKEIYFEPTRDVPWSPGVPGRYKVLGIPSPGGSGDYRVILPFHALQQAGRVDVAVAPPENGGVPVLSVVEMARFQPDALLIHTMLREGVQYAVRQYREFLPDLRIVFGLDDLVGALPEKSILHKIWRKTMPDARPKLREMLANVDSLVVSTEPLADACRDMIDEIHVIPNRLPRHMWDNLSSKRGAGKMPRVGWVGAMQHQGDLALIIDVVKATYKEVDWVFMGMCLPELRPYVAEEYGWTVFAEYPEKMASLNLDLAIAPLEINAFNEAKSNLRLLEYGAMRWPVICTDIFPYQTNNAPVCRLANESRLWIEAIRARVHDLDAAYREGDELWSWVNRHYWLEDHLQDWQQALIGQTAKK